MKSRLGKHGKIIEQVERKGDFLIMNNELGAISQTTFVKGGDDTLPCKELLCDQIQNLAKYQLKQKKRVEA